MPIDLILINNVPVNVTPPLTASQIGDNNLLFTSPDGPTNITYSISSQPPGGFFAHITDQGTSIGSFSQVELNNFVIVYVDTSGVIGPRSVEFQVSDLDESVTIFFVVNVNPAAPSGRPGVFTLRRRRRMQR